MSRLEFDPQKGHESEDDFQPQPDEQASHHRLALPEDEAAAAAAEANRLQYVEQLLRNAPLLSVPIGFADRVVAAIKGQDHDDPNYQDATGIVLGLLFAALIAIPLFATPVYLTGRALLNGESRTAILAELESVMSSFLLWLESLSLTPIIFIPLALAVLVGLILVSGYVLWFFRSLLKSGRSNVQQ